MSKDLNFNIKVDKNIKLNKMIESPINNLKFQNNMFKSSKQFVSNMGNVIEEVTFNNDFGSCYSIEGFLGQKIPYSTKVKYTGKIEEYTDYQNCLLVELCTNRLNSILLDNNIDYKGKTLYEIYANESLSKDDKSILESYIASGFGDLRVVDVIKGEDSFDSIVFQDVDGNYLISFPCTDKKESEDLMYDIEHALDVDYDQSIYNNQIAQAMEVAQKYYDEAKQNGTTININGYSLGGSIAEEVYLRLAEKESATGTIEYVDDEALGNLIVYEGLHTNINSDRQKFLEEQKSKEKIYIYNAEGSMVSSYVSFEELKDIAIPIYVDYQKLYKDSIEGYSEIDIAILKKLIMIMTIIKNYSLFYSGGPHKAELPRQFAEISFDENGNVRGQVITESGVHAVENISFPEITSEIFGIDLESFLESLRKLDIERIPEDILKDILEELV